MNFSSLTVGKRIAIGFAALSTVLVIVAVITYAALGGAGCRDRQGSRAAQRQSAAG